MSLARNILKTKNYYNSIAPITNAEFYTKVLENKHGFYLYANSNFKSVEIHYNGTINIIKSDYDGLYINNNNNVINIVNYNKISLDDDLLFYFHKKYMFIKKIVVYNWGSSSIIANKQRYEDDTFGRNQNIFDSCSIIIGKTSDIISMTRFDEEVILNNSDIVENLYTEGNKLTLNSEDYVGYYHYHVKTKKLMTGTTHTSESEVLTRKL